MGENRAPFCFPFCASFAIRFQAETLAVEAGNAPYHWRTMTVAAPPSQQVRLVVEGDYLPHPPSSLV